jgi:hypothetical protein
MAQLLGPVRGFTSAAVVSLMQRSDQIIAVRQEIGSLLLLPVLRETVLKYSSYWYSLLPVRLYSLRAVKKHCEAHSAAGSSY